MTQCQRCGTEYDGPTHHCKDGYIPRFSTLETVNPTPVRVDVIHPEWAFDIKISNDNTKGEKRVTVHVRGDIDPTALKKKAHELYVEELGS